MVLKPSESERRKFQRLHKQLLYFEEPLSFTKLFRTYQEYCDSSVGTQRLAVNGDAYAELAVKLAEFLIKKWVSSHSIARSQANTSISSASGRQLCVHYSKSLVMNSTRMRTMIVHPFCHLLVRMRRCIALPVKRIHLTFTVPILLPGRL